MGFWKDGTGKLKTRFRLMIVNRFSLRRAFQGIVSHLVLPSVIKSDRSTFLCDSEIQWAEWFTVYAF